MSLTDAMRRLLFLSLALAAGTTLARGLPAAAQIRTAFDAIDTSRNNALSLEEWDRAAFALFHATDRNKNDLIDTEDLQSGTIAHETLLHADADRDGRISVAEFMDLRRALFRIADIDRDDHLVSIEFELLIVMEQVGWTDQNQNGRIELSELRESLGKAFEQFDGDNDGNLSPGEAIHVPVEEFRAFDRNRDGQLTREEFTAGYRAALLGEK